MLKAAGGPGAKFLTLGAVVMLFHVIAVVGLVVAGKWQYGPPDLMVKINPLYSLADGGQRMLLPRSLFDSLSNATQVASAANLLVYAAIQWLGLGLLLDLIRPSK
jgi:hypothetical protein